MFDSQFCSLASITFLVQILGIALAVAFRLRRPGSLLNHVGLCLGILLMAASAFVCLRVDIPTGLFQGVALVGVAIATTWHLTEPKSAGF